MMAAEEEGCGMKVDVAGNTRTLQFLHDRLNPALPANTKDVRTLMVGINAKTINLYAILPDGTSLSITSLEISNLKQCIPSDYLGRGAFLSGLLGRFSSPPSDLRVYPALTGSDREGLLISGCIDGDISFWYWNPWSRQGIISSPDEEEEDDGETGLVQFLCRGPTELDKISSASLVQLQNERSNLLSLLIVSPLGSIYSLTLGDEVPCTAQWTCHESSEDPISDIRIDRYDHETVSISLIRQEHLSLLMFGPNGLIDLGSVKVNGEKVKLAFWREDQYCCLIECQLVGVSVANGQAERIFTHHLPNYPIWTLYSDEALEADAIVCGLGFGVVEFFSIRSASLESLLRSDQLLPQGHVTDLMMEPSMQVKVLLALEDKSYVIFTLPELMKLQSWTDTAVKHQSKMEFARWFDLMSPYTPGQEHARLCIDELLESHGKALYPPKSWSDLGRLVESLPSDDTRTFLYLLLDAKEDPARISSFCRRYSVDGYHLHLVRALHSFDTGNPAEALHHMVLALRSETILLDGHLSLVLSKVVPMALRDEPVLMILAYRLVGGSNRLALSEEAILDAYLKLEKYSQALQFARDQDLVPFLMGKLPPSITAKLTLSEEELLHLCPHSMTLYHFARGKTLSAVEAFESWRSSGVPLDDPSLVKMMASMQQFRAVLPKSNLSAVGREKPLDRGVRTKSAVSTASMLSNKTGTVTPTSPTKTPTKKTPATTPITTPIAVSPLKPLTPTALTPTAPIATPTRLTLRSSPVSATSSPTSSPSAAGSSPKTTGSASSPPLRSVLPRHVPANQPSRLANLVESSGDDDSEDMGLMSGEMLEANLFTRAMLDEMEEVEPSTTSEEYETVDEMIGSEIVTSSSSPRRSPVKSSPGKSSPVKNSSPSKPPTTTVEKISPKKRGRPPKTSSSPTKSSPVSPRSPSAKSATSPTRSISPTRSHTASIETNESVGQDSPRRYNLRQHAPIHYPDSSPSPRRHRHQSPTRTKPREDQEPKYVLSTPKVLKVKAAETKSQFKKRIREDLALPSPIVKRTRATKAPGSDEAFGEVCVSASPRRTGKIGTPKRGLDPTTPTRTSTRSRSKLATPSLNRTAEDAGTGTPPVRATPPAALRRGRR